MGAPMSKNSTIYQHALRELRAKGMLGTAEPLAKSVLGAVMLSVDVLSDHAVKDVIPEHITDLLFKVLDHLPLSPLTGDEKEWEYKSPGLEVNKRCPRVIREDGVAYDTQAVMFEHPDGYQNFNAKSKQPITFPYVPITHIEIV